MSNIQCKCPNEQKNYENKEIVVEHKYVSFEFLLNISSLKFQFNINLCFQILFFMRLCQFTYIIVSINFLG
jgi:hypothetical protein